MRVTKSKVSLILEGCSRRGVKISLSQTAKNRLGAKTGFGAKNARDKIKSVFNIRGMFTEGS